MKLLRRAVGLLVCLLLLNMNVFAEEEFTLRNGILFGDTMEDILQKEQTLIRSGDDSTSFTGRIAGFDGATCDFEFDDDDKLISMTYGFDCSSKDSMKDDYKTLYSSLVRQYGAAEGNTGGSCELITGPAISRMAMWVYLFGEVDGWAADYYDYDEWIIDCSDYHVKIDLVSYYYRNSDYEYTYIIDLSYHKYTDEDYEAAVQEKATEREEIDNDL